MKVMNSAKECNTTHGKSVLSYFTASVSILFLICTSVLNLLILLAFYRNKKLVRKSIFHKIIFNIALADLMTALISDTVSISFHLKEGLGKPVSIEEVRLLHYGLFFINGASILTMSLLCFDRVFALIKPIKYMKGLNEKLTLVLIVSTWILSAILTLPYFYIGYIRYLAVFSSTTVAITCVSLIIVAMVYRKKFSSFRPITPPSLTPSTDKYICENVKNDEYDVNLTSPATVHKTYKAHRVAAQSKRDTIQHETGRDVEIQIKIKNEGASREQRVNQSFVILLAVFLGTYLPSVMMTMYMNLCENCNCMFIHSLRDLTYLSILSSALWRPLNFILRLKTLNKAVRDIFASDSPILLSQSSSKMDGSKNISLTVL